MSFVKQLAGQTAIYGLSNILSRVLHYVLLTVYLTRVFEPQIYAIYTDLYAWVALLLILFTLRMETAYFRFGSESNQKDSAFTQAGLTILIISACLITFMIGFRNELAALLTYPDKGRYVVYFACILGLDALAAIPFAKLRLDEQPMKFATLKIINILVTLCLVFLFLEGFPWLIDHGWDGVKAYYSLDHRLDLVFIANLMASAVVFLLLVPGFKHIRIKYSNILWKKMIWYVLPLVIVGMAGVFNQSFAVPLLKYLLPGNQDSILDTAGLYAAAAKLALLMNLFTQAFNYAAEPFFFKHADSKDAKKIYAEVAQAFALVASIVFLGILLYLDVIVLILGPDYRQSIVIVPILLMAFWCLGLYYNFSIWYKILDKTHVGALISVGGSLITFGIAFTMIAKYQEMAMASATLACYAFMCLAGYLTGQYYYPVKYPMSKMATYLALAILTYMASRALDPLIENNLMVISIHSLLLLLYLLVIYLLDRDKIRAWITLPARNKI